MYGSASELRATLEYDFSQEKDFGDAKVDIQDEKVGKNLMYLNAAAFCSALAWLNM